jgi:hypothetical protein
VIPRNAQRRTTYFNFATPLQRLKRQKLTKPAPKNAVATDDEYFHVVIFISEA